MVQEANSSKTVCFQGLLIPQSSALRFLIDAVKLLDKFNKYDVVTVSSIILLGIYFLAKIVLVPCTVWGESDDFKIAGISVVNHLTTTITDFDIEQCCIEFPEEEFRLTEVFNGGGSTFNGKTISFYFPTYSIACLPIKGILSTFPFDIPLNYSLLLTNLFFYCGALLFIFFQLHDIPKLNRLVMVLLLAFSPAMEYINVPSYEAFIYALVSCSAVQLYRKSFKSAALLGAIAASANIAIIGFVFFIVVSYLYNRLKPYKINLWLKQCLLNIKDIGLLVVCCLPIFLQLIYFRMLIGKYSPQQTGFAEFSGIIPRFFAYIFDYNFSFFAYYPLIVILFFLCLGYFAYKGCFDKVFFCCGILFSLLLYSIMVHINCGQESLHRYNTHLLGAFLIISVTSALFSTASKKPIYVCIISLFLANGIYLLNSSVPYVYFSPIPKLILNNVPELYNPLYSTFISRVEHRDGGYDYRGPVYYTDSRLKYKNEIRKILVRRADKDRLLDEVVFGNEKSRIGFETQLNKISGHGGEYVYLNIPPKNQIWKNPFWQEKNYKMSLIFSDDGTHTELVPYFPVTLKPYMLYKVECDIEDAGDILFHADFYAPNSGYDFWQAEEVLNTSIITAPDYYAYVNSDDISVVGENQIYLRILPILNSNNKQAFISKVKNIRLYEMLPK